MPVHKICAVRWTLHSSQSQQMVHCLKDSQCAHALCLHSRSSRSHLIPPTMRDAGNLLHRSSLHFEFARAEREMH